LAKEKSEAIRMKYIFSSTKAITILVLGVLIPQEAASRVLRGSVEDGVGNTKINSFNDIGTYIDDTVDKAKDEFKSIEKDLFSTEKDRLMEEIDHILDRKVKESVEMLEMLGKLPSIDEDEITSRFQELVDFVKKNEMDKLETAAKNVADDAEIKMKTITKNVQKDISKNQPLDNEIISEMNEELEDLKEIIEESLKDESYMISMSLDQDIEDIKKNFVEDILQSVGNPQKLGSQNTNANKEIREDIKDEIENDKDEFEDGHDIHEDADHADDTYEVRVENERDWVGLKEKDRINASKDREPFDDSLIAEAEAMNEKSIQTVLKTEDELKKEVERLERSLVERILPQATEKEKKTILKVAVDLILKNELERFESAVDAAISEEYSEDVERLAKNEYFDIMNNLHHEAEGITRVVIEDVLGIEL